MVMVSVCVVVREWLYCCWFLVFVARWCSSLVNVCVAVVLVLLGVVFCVRTLDALRFALLLFAAILAATPPPRSVAG